MKLVSENGIINIHLNHDEVREALLDLLLKKGFDLSDANGTIWFPNQMTANIMFDTLYDRTQKR